MSTFEVIADNGKQPEMDEIFTDHLAAYKAAIQLSARYLYVALYENNRLIEEYGPNYNVVV